MADHELGLTSLDPTPEEGAARLFPRWFARRRSEIEQQGDELVVNYRKLTRYVHAFIESSYAHLPPSQRPAVDETERLVRSAWARKAGRTRKKRAQATKRLAIAEQKKAAAPEQGELFK